MSSPRRRGSSDEKLGLDSPLRGEHDGASCGASSMDWGARRLSDGALILAAARGRHDALRIPVVLTMKARARQPRRAGGGLARDLAGELVFHGRAIHFRREDKSDLAAAPARILQP